ncbi:tRNA pseudouridine(55) synthase TruB [Elioraea tepida]|uniref:tRNA pseudouridine synthase B n=1 Tax=Elioraea tepida TaxID=2843330 RepID=A0A975YIT3_9PROT|nr:tRNA pseudouridine(55) synthase TruB [Elioraea tepida]QXM23737.1 tRNA pseudouridine(55) synthase TruB [Elioraea tepida]
MPRTRKGRPIDGWIVIDKPAGLTSTDVVNAVKRSLAAQKVGHAGTLDPIATGVLPLALGAGTKTVPYVMDGTKEYVFTLRFGEARDSDDADGVVTETSDVRPTDAAIRAALPAFTGTIMQVPPRFSAVKVQGERAYDLARAGAEVELAPRPAQVDRFELVARPDADTAVFVVESGKGVYMRSLARDLARALGTVGHVAALRRRRVGPFTEAQAVSLDKLLALGQDASALSLVLPVETALADIPALALTGEEAARLANGQALSLVPFLSRMPQDVDPDGGLVRVMAGGKALALGRLGDGMLHPVRLLSHAE